VRRPPTDGEVREEQLAGEMAVGVVRSRLGPVQELDEVVVIGEAIRTPRLVEEDEEDDLEQNLVAGIGIGMVIEWTGVFHLLDANPHLREVEEAGVTGVVDGIDPPAHVHAPSLGLHRGGDGTINVFVKLFGGHHLVCLISAFAISLNSLHQNSMCFRWPRR